jgi:hypothetical protein
MTVVQNNWPIKMWQNRMWLWENSYSYRGFLGLGKKTTRVIFPLKKTHECGFLIRIHYFVTKNISFGWSSSIICKLSFIKVNRWCVLFTRMSSISLRPNRALKCLLSPWSQSIVYFVTFCCIFIYMNYYQWMYLITHCWKLWMFERSFTKH